MLARHPAGSDPDGSNARRHFFPYFTWQQDQYLDMEGKVTLETQEVNPWNLAYNKINSIPRLVQIAPNGGIMIATHDVPLINNQQNRQ